MSFSRRDNERDDRGVEKLRVAEEGFVTSVENPSGGEEPVLRVESRFDSTETGIYVPHLVAGDKGLPTEGDRIYFIRLIDDTGVFVGTAADDHTGYDDERTWNWPHSDTSITINERGNITILTEDTKTNNVTTVTLDNGDITVESDDGTKVTLDTDLSIDTADGTTVTVDNDTVQINGGSTPVVTDVTTTTDSDGHVTSIDTVTSDSVHVS
jgi:hypothetical protein